MSFPVPSGLNHTSTVKQAVTGILLVAVGFLMLFPLITTLNQFLVKVIEPLTFLQPVQKVIIPYEVRLVRVILGLASVPMTEGQPGAASITLIDRKGEHQPVSVAWNCIGWQSFLLVVATFLTGLTGRLTFLSKLEVLVVGLLGTFLLNIGRIAGIFYLYYHTNQRVAIAFHDYGSVALTIIWLWLLWYYAFTFVLEQKRG